MRLASVARSRIARVSSPVPRATTGQAAQRSNHTPPPAARVKISRATPPLPVVAGSRAHACRGSMARRNAFPAAPVCSSSAGKTPPRPPATPAPRQTSPAPQADKSSRLLPADAAPPNVASAARRRRARCCASSPPPPPPQWPLPPRQTPAPGRLATTPHSPDFPPAGGWR